MFAVDLQTSQYSTYRLSDHSTQSLLEVVPDRGGIITRWAVNGQEILYLDTERFANPELTVRGGVPILFPICGNLPDNTYSYAGQSYSLKQHGFARDLPWTVAETRTHDAASITLTLSSDETTRSRYPFEFDLTFTYRIRGNTLEIHQQVTNRSTEPLPFSVGLHPYFWVPNKSQLQFEIPATEFTDQRSHITHKFLNGFDFELDEIDVIFPNLSAASATVIDRGRKLKLEFHYTDPYTMLVFWTVKGKDYYCLEPWTAGRNALNTGDRLTHLPAGASLDTTFRLVATFQ